MFKAFKDDSIANKALWLIPVNTNGKREEADDFGGVFRDLLSAFWSAFFNKAAQGITAMVPSIRHDFHMEDWQSICRILLKGSNFWKAPTWNPFRNVDNLHTISDAKPSVKQVTKLFVCSPENDREKEVFEYLKWFLRVWNSETLAKFLRYVTEADMLCVQNIDVMFNNLSDCERTIVAHTCGPTVELPRH